MSKKCCGIIYNENEKFCTMCGKALNDLPDIEEEAKEEATVESTVAKAEESDILDMAEVDRIAASVMGIQSSDKVDSVAEDKEATENDDSAENTGNAENTTDEQKDTEDNKDKVEEPKEKEEKNNSDEEDEDEDEEDDGTASPGLKFFGTLMIILMLVSIVAVGLGIYFIVLNPFYKNHDITSPVIYEEMSTDTDVSNIVTRPALTEVSLVPATETDSSDAADAIATESDATESDATEIDASEDME